MRIAFLYKKIQVYGDEHGAVGSYGSAHDYEKPRQIFLILHFFEEYAGKNQKNNHAKSAQNPARHRNGL